MPRKTFKLLCAALAFCDGSALAADIAVTVLDRDGLPVPDVAVYVERDEPHAAAPDGRRAVMDQVNTRFVPHLLVVQKGTYVEFPNSDTIAHHVYSFSDPNGFLLPLYKGDAHPPVLLGHPGVVTLGCNIHDGMLAYILVVDGPEFGKTDAAGRLTLATDGDAGQRVTIWSPRIRPRGETLTQEIGSGELTFRLRGALRPAHDAESGGVEWSDY
ncbi:MAG: methylamine utilization protein [Gammaproteobacteria bacterium]|nr:methylamine utilization protein [Gammaproteobacteria bacterium]